MRIPRLKQILGKPLKDLIFRQLMAMGDPACFILDLDGECLLGEPFPNPEVVSTIKVEEKIIGAVYGQYRASCVGKLLQYAVSSYMQKRGIASDLSEKYRELNQLYRFSEIIASSMEPAETAKLAAEAACKDSKDRIETSVMLIDNEAEVLTVLHSSGGISFTNGALLPLNQFYRDIINFNRGEIVNNISSDERLTGWDGGANSIVCTPMAAGRSVFGMIQIASSKENFFTSEDLKHLQSLATQSARAIESSRLYSEMKETFFRTLLALSESIALKDPFIGGHSTRVTDYSISIGEAMGLEQTDMINLRLAAMLHDIGKVGVPDAILLKQNYLTPDEKNIMAKHVLIGADVVGKIKRLRHISPAIRSHHERFDGRGYPDKLKKFEICLNARIISVANEFDNMTSTKSRQKKTPHEAIMEITRLAGSLFDPDIVEIALRPLLRTASGVIS